MHRELTGCARLQAARDKIEGDTKGTQHQSTDLNWWEKKHEQKSPLVSTTFKRRTKARQNKTSNLDGPPAPFPSESVSQLHYLLPEVPVPLPVVRLCGERRGCTRNQVIRNGYIAIPTNFRVIRNGYMSSVMVTELSPMYPRVFMKIS
jgi:hypothetical protein